MQRQMNERFIDREVIRQKQIEFMKNTKKERAEDYWLTKLNQNKQFLKLYFLARKDR